MTRHTQRISASLITMLWLLVAIGLGGSAWAEPATASDWRLDGGGFDNVVDPAQKLLADAALWRALATPEAKSASLLDEPITLEHDVPIGDGRTLYVKETFTLRAWLRWPRRAVLFLHGSAFNGDHFHVPVEGYNAAEMVARRGMFAFSVDLLGVRNSYRPADGTEADFAANVDAMATLLRYIRFFRAIPRIDLFGEGYGGSVATQLAADATRVRSVSMSAMLYKDITGGPLTDPVVIALLQSSPDGYFFIPGEGSAVFLVGTPQPVIDWVYATQGGSYPTPNFLVVTQLPFFDPSVARVPGLLIRGTEEFVAGPDDGIELAADYGTSGATLVILEGAGHAPRLESEPVAAAFWQTVFDFIDP